VVLRFIGENSATNENDVHIAGFSDQILRYAVFDHFAAFIAHLTPNGLSLSQ